MRHLKTLVVAVAAVAFASSAWAQVNLNDATRKARGDYGQHDSVARTYVAPRAAAPAAERTFSYEPAPAAKSAAPAPAAPQKAAQAPAAQPRRTFSYEPQAARGYRAAPRRDTPSLLLPKGDARRVAPVIHW